MVKKRTQATPAAGPERRPLCGKREQAQAVLLDRIRRREWRPGGFLPSEAELVAELGISRATVRRALRHMIVQGVIESRPGIGHVVCSTQPSPRIGLLFGKQVFQPGGSPFDQLVIQACLREAQRRHGDMAVYMTRLGTTPHRGDRQRLIRDIRRGLIRGILAVGWPCPVREDADAARRDAELSALFQSKSIPCVGINCEEQPGTVDCDFYQLGRRGVLQGLDRGVRRIGLVVACECAGAHERVVAGYRDALSQAGVAVRPQDICHVTAPTEASAYQAFTRWWPKAGALEAVIVADDNCCRGVILAAMELGIDIPQSLMVASLAIAGSQAFVPRPYVRLEIDPAELAVRAFANLLGMMQHPDAPPPPRTLIPPRVLPLDAGKRTHGTERLAAVADA